MSPGPVPYVDFLVPGFVMTSVLFAGTGTAAGVAEDVEHGFFDRLRSLPVPRSALLAGRTLADTGVLAWASPPRSASPSGSASTATWRWHWPPRPVRGLRLRHHVAVRFDRAGGRQRSGRPGHVPAGVPLTFVSSAYVPVDSMPGWLQAIAEHQPITVMTNAVRSLALGDPSMAGLSGTTAHWVVLSLLWSAGLVLVFAAPLAVARYRAHSRWRGGARLHQWTDPTWSGGSTATSGPGAPPAPDGLGDLFSPDASTCRRPGRRRSRAWRPLQGSGRTSAMPRRAVHDGPRGPRSRRHDGGGAGERRRQARGHARTALAGPLGPPLRRRRPVRRLRGVAVRARSSGTATSTRPDGRPASLAGGRRELAGCQHPEHEGDADCPGPRQPKVRPRVAAVRGPGWRW